MTRSTALFESLENRRLLSATGGFSGVVFNDHNGSGTIDAGEPGLAGAKVFIDLKNTGVFANGDPYTVTAKNGNYSFANLKPGKYAVDAQILSGYQQTFPYAGVDAAVTVTAGKTTPGFIFGQTTATHVGGTVMASVNGKPTPVAGATVSIQSTKGGGAYVRTTDAYGLYGIGGLPQGAYKVTLTLPDGYSLASGSLVQTTPTLGSGKSDNNVNFTLAPNVIVGTATRFVQVTSATGDGINYPETVNPTITQTASGASPFNGNVSYSTTKKYLESGPGDPLFYDTITVSGSATQKSTLSNTEITDSGETIAFENDNYATGPSFAEGHSYFQETFTVAHATNFSLAASLAGDPNYGQLGYSATFSFTGPGGAQVVPTQTGDIFNPLDVQQSGTLAAGKYTITFDVVSNDNGNNSPGALYALDLKF